MNKKNEIKKKNENEKMKKSNQIKEKIGYQRDNNHDGFRASRESIPRVLAARRLLQSVVYIGNRRTCGAQLIFIIVRRVARARQLLASFCHFQRIGPLIASLF